jgi:ubiquinone/menaquinone biosynthesis C-methylase UbiE
VSDPIAAFYGRYAALYDTIATLPIVNQWRATAVDHLELSSGDTVIEMGCGSGANLTYLAERVGPTGHVLGVDLTPELLDIARTRTAHIPQVTVCRGDVTQPPVAAADGVLGTFVTGMFTNPAAVVKRWCKLVTGRVTLMDLSASAHPIGYLLNPLFRAFTAASAPLAGPTDVVYELLPGTATEDILAKRVRAGRKVLTNQSNNRRFETFGLGFCGLLSGAVS